MMTLAPASDVSPLGGALSGCWSVVCPGSGLGGATPQPQESHCRSATPAREFLRGVASTLTRTGSIRLLPVTTEATD